MSDPFIGEIRMFAGTFAPRGWARCDGQLLDVSQNDALFSLLGTIYGGDGRTEFGLPDMRGRLPVHQGQGPGLSPRALGSKGGSETVTLTLQEIPNHSHELQCSTAAGDSDDPAGRFLAAPPTARSYRAIAPNTNLAGDKVQATGGSQPHNNLMPSLCVHFIIALVGIYPSRN